MRVKRSCGAGLLACAAAWGGGGAVALGEGEVVPAHAGLSPLAPLIGGEWVVDDARWSFGRVTDVREVYRWGPGRATIVADVYVSDDDGPEYHRYRTVYACPDGGAITGYTFARDGSVSTAEVRVEEGGRRFSFVGEESVAQSVTLEGDDTFTWHVEQVDEDGTRSELLTALSHRRGLPPPSSEAWSATGGAMAAAPGDLSERAIVHEVVVPVVINEAWRLWTTEEGLGEWLVGRDVERRPNCDVELRVGGPYEFYFAPDAPEGERGGEGNVVLAFEPGRMLAFTWNAPPKFAPEREQRTWVVVRFEEAGQGRTRVELTHLGWPDSGWGDGSDWPDVYAYFDRAWGAVLGAMASYLEKREADPTRVNLGERPPLFPQLSGLAWTLGDWECTAAWGDGRPFWGRMESRPIMGGAFIETRILSRSDEEGVYPRYYQLTAWDRAARSAVVYDFRYDGGVHVLPLEPAGAGELGIEFPPGARAPGVRLRSLLREAGENAMTWEMSAEQGGAWTPLMDARWERDDAHGD